MTLDFMPSPAPDRPGLFIRDPYHYSDAMLIVPPPLVTCLRCFDGEQTELDLRAELVRITETLEVGDVERQLIETLSASGFLENDVFEQMKEKRHREFAVAQKRDPAHCGTAYPAEVEPLRETLNRYMDGRAAIASLTDGLCGVAAPHVSPEGGWQSYQAAYSVLTPEYRHRTFVILGTSHYGEPERFGLTRKCFVTPFGETVPDLDLIAWLEQHGGPAVSMEDYCHFFEHTIEFQVLFLQHIYGPDVRVVPILCGQYARSLYEGGRPESDEAVNRFLDALGELAAREGDRLFWVLGIDMAHMGARYRDPFPARAHEGRMQSVADRDRARIARIEQGDAMGFWELVQENQDDLKWCGSSPVYTLLRAIPGLRGNLLRYEQWNIDPQSVVSFAGISFAKA